MENTKISWTETILPDGTIIPGATYNPWIGCTRVSPGCLNCYAERENNQRHWTEKWGPGIPRHQTSDSYRTKPFMWDDKARKGGYRMKVFCGSLMDIFDPEVPDEWRQELWETQEETPYLDWLNLTKRIENANEMLPQAWLYKGFPANIWMGISAENQEWYDKRIYHLMRLPARIKFISVEPMLGLILPPNTRQPMTNGSYASKAYPDWFIFGGESGPNYREMDIEDLRTSIEFCVGSQVKDENIRIYVKQDSGLYPGQQGRIPDDLWNLKEFPE